MVQLTLEFRRRRREHPNWGGKRKNAGRKPKGEKAGVSHDARPALASRFPVHVTMRLVEGLPNLRCRRLHAVIRKAIGAVCDRPGVRVVHYSVQSNHLHFIVEAKHAEALSRGMQALAVRIALGINHELGRKRGKVFADRFHSRILKTALEVKACIAYVINNARKHAKQAGQWIRAAWVDPYSSARWFDGYRGRRPEKATDEHVTSAPGTWLLRVGWRKKWGLLPVATAPG